LRPNRDASLRVGRTAVTVTPATLMDSKSAFCLVPSELAPYRKDGEIVLISAAFGSAGAPVGEDARAASRQARVSRLAATYPLVLRANQYPEATRAGHLCPLHAFRNIARRRPFSALVTSALVGSAVLTVARFAGATIVAGGIALGSDRRTADGHWTSRRTRGLVPSRHR
jgi:hypothetical protein